MKPEKSTPFRILIGIAILLSLLYLLGQTMAVIDYDLAVSIGLQESKAKVTEVGVALNKAFGLADTLVYIPLLILGVIGLLKRKTYGLYTMLGAMAITMYWPIVAMFTLIFAKNTPGFHFNDYLSYSILLSLIFLYGLWGFLYLFWNRMKLSET